MAPPPWSVGPRGAEYSVAGGRARRFQKGRIFYKARGSARTSSTDACSRPTSNRGAATSRLGFPLTKPQRVAGKRIRARFEHGTISVRRHGKMRTKVTFTS